MAAVKEFFGKTDLLYLVQLLDTEFGKYLMAVNGKGLSTNDFTDILKTKLEGIDLSKYSTTDEMTTAISTALADVTGIRLEKVDSYDALPVSGELGVIYLVPNNGTAPNVSDEYFWNGGGYELFGTTSIDLSGYLKADDVQELSKEEVQAIWDSVFSS
jgi:predicted heme/steroid binding protein